MENKKEKKYNYNKNGYNTAMKEHIDLVVDQTGCSRKLARDTLMRNNNDVVNTIMYIYDNDLDDDLNIMELIKNINDKKYLNIIR